MGANSKAGTLTDHPGPGDRPTGGSAGVGDGHGEADRIDQACQLDEEE
jgi:hypothetical protein